jgi:outer membrane protein OmpA-like peptidoglycan-associated protein
MTCAKCGASFGETDKFCAKCGAARPADAPAAASPNFCQRCGTSFTATDRFCAKCGSLRTAPAGQAGSSSATVAAARPAAAPQKSSGSKVILVILALVAIFAITAVAGVVYLGYRAKKKVEEISQTAKQTDETALLRAITGKGDSNQPPSANSQAGPNGQSQQGNSPSGQNDGTDAAIKKLAGDGAEALMKKMMGGVSSADIPKLPEWKAAPADLVSSPASKIPLRVSLRLVVAGTEPARGDYESIFLVDSVTEKQIHISAHQQFPKKNDMNNVQAGSPAAAVKIDCSQIEFKADLENSAESGPYFCMQGREDKFPGTTSLGLSKKTFADLKAGRDTPFIAHENPMNQLFKSFKDLVTGSGDSADFLNRVLNAAPGSTPQPSPPLHYTLHRAGPEVAFPVLVNDQPTQLPALHVTVLQSDGTNDGDVYVLDDSDNPLILAGQTKPFGTAQTVKISWNSDKPSANPIEQQLQKEGRAKIYGIYFDFGSNQLRPESEAVLNEIAQALRAHPDWKLNIEGHTDNIGGAAYNQNLSNTRAEAVKKALMSGYRIDAGRLTPQGFGDTRPAATNDTLEGRALNRRVELVRN